MIKSLVLAAVTTVGALGATSAHAGVSWSVNINTPVVGTVVSGGPGYYGSGYRHGYRGGYDRVYAPVYAPAPVYRVPPRAAYYPPAVVYRAAPVVYPRYYPGWRQGNDRHDRWDRRDRGDRHDRGDRGGDRHDRGDHYRGR
ncbi:MAG: hypothetical protein V4750_04000 [Pseudomonadota bacterium]